MEEHEKEPSKRIAQHRLAQEVLSIVHGERISREAKQQHGSMFKNSFAANPRTSQDGSDSKKHVNGILPFANIDKTPTHSLVLPKSLIYNQPMARVLYHAGLVPSRSEGQRMVNKKGAYLGARPGGTGTMGEQVDFSPATNWNPKDTQKYLIGEDTLIIRVGKWKVKVIKVISDEEFEEQGLSAPGWKEEPEKLPIDIVRMKSWNKKGYVAKAAIHRGGPIKN